MNLAYKKILGKFTQVLGFGKTPPPCWEKFPNNIVFFSLRAYLIPYIPTYVKQGCCAAHPALFGLPPSLILMSIMVIMMVMVVSPENMKVEEGGGKSEWVGSR